MAATLDHEMADLRHANAELQRRLEEALAERDENAAQKAAMAEILQVINASPADLAPVFDAILERAMGLCDAAFGTLRTTQDGQHFDLAALRRVPPALADYLEHDPPTIGSGRGPARILEGERVVHVLDAAADDTYRSGPPGLRALVDLGGARTVLSVGMRKDDRVLGVITIYRQEVRPFTEKQIALLQNFAAQAVVAMENARLITETREALDQQTATAEILRVISGSPTDLQPTFDAIVANATILSGAEAGGVFRFDGSLIHFVAHYGWPADVLEAVLRSFPIRPGRHGTTARAILTREVAHIPDAAADPEYALPAILQTGVHTMLSVPILQDGNPVGAITVTRREVAPFSQAQIDLLKTFADQAVIAIENVRLFNETREALEQQTATAEVLQVINSSPGDLKPVFDAILDKAHSLCGAELGVLFTYDGDCFWPVAAHGVSAEFNELMRDGFSPHPGNPFTSVRDGEPLVHISDIRQLASEHPDDSGLRLAVEIGLRTFLIVPLYKDDVLLGVITANRREVHPFSDKQIALLQNFAAQAVIAMENARLLTETREALEQQTATAEVLQVINSSPGDLGPVFREMLQKATRLCDAPSGIFWTFDGVFSRATALHGIPQSYAEYLQEPVPLDPRTGLGQVRQGRPIVVDHDVAAGDPYRTGNPQRRALVDLGRARSVVRVPLIKDSELLGILTVYRHEVRPFTDKQIVLLQNFAAQAVIAMENARLITETREALEQQTATAEVLQVINASPGDLTPVFDALLEKALRLSGSAFGILNVFDGQSFQGVAMRGVPPAFAEFRAGNPAGLGAGTAPARILAGENLVHNLDLMDEEAYRSGDPYRRAIVDLGGARSHLAVALRKDNVLLGMLTVYRQEVRAFSEKEIALLQNFAAQAVIAMENARLITETREALEQQTATAEVLQVINSSPGNLAPVFDAMLEKAVGLCDAAYGVLRTFDGEFFHLVAMRGEPDAVVHLKQLGAIDLGSVRADDMLGRIVRGEEVVHIADIRETHTYRDNPIARERAEAANQRTWLAVALRKDAALLGVIMTYRAVVRPFSDKQIALLQNFATQAVIAMENARLITETREALEQQTATAEVLQVINSSPGNLAPVFDAMLERATHLCEAEYGLLGTYGPEGFRGAAALGLPMGSADALSRIGHPPAGTSLGRVERTRETVQIVDIAQEPAYAEVFKVNPWLRQVHSNLVVPLLKDDELIGVFILFRGQVRPFTDKQIALVQNFAAQAVIAMENARLLNEIRQRQAELRVTFDNMVDGVAMFDEELRLAAWNRNFQQLLDVPDEFLVERHGFDTYIRYLTERGEFGETDPETQIKRLRDRLQDHYSFERTRPDGTVIEVRHNPMPDGGVVLIYSDITERKRSEAEIRAARDAAEAAYRDLKAAQASLVQAEKMASLGQLTAGIAHEIKNPLNFVNNFAGLSVELLDELKETAAPAITALDDVKRAEIDETIEMLTGNLEKIAEHGRRADNIVKSMLEHSRGSSGERRTVDLNGLIEEALNLAYHGGRAQDQSFNVNLERDYADALPPIELVPQDITRVCLNLFTNGFYATTKRQREGGDPNFKPTLKVSTRELGDAVGFRIRDNGTGIPPEIKDKLFQPFFTTKPTGEGTGLGLSISYDIVTQQHGGTIAVDSRVGEFTEFTIRLPRTHRVTIAEAAS